MTAWGFGIADFEHCADINSELGDSWLVHWLVYMSWMLSQNCSSVLHDKNPRNSAPSRNTQCLIFTLWHTLLVVAGTNGPSSKAMFTYLLTSTALNFIRFVNTSYMFRPCGTSSCIKYVIKNNTQIIRQYWYGVPKRDEFHKNQ